MATPVAKAPRTAHPNLFKPIRVTSVVCKVLEAIRVFAHWAQFSLLTSRQRSFLPRRLTLTNLVVAEKNDNKIAPRLCLQDCAFCAPA